MEKEEQQADDLEAEGLTLRAERPGLRRLYWVETPAKDGPHAHRPIRKALLCGQSCRPHRDRQS